MYFPRNRLCRGRACRRQRAPSSGVMRAMGGMAGTTRATNDNGIIVKNFVVLESLQHIPECKRYQNDIDDIKSATVDGRKFATATTCLACVAHAANNANATVDSKPLAPKYNVGTRLLHSALRNLRVSRDPPVVTVFIHTTLNLGGKGCTHVSEYVLAVHVCSLRTFFRQQSCYHS